MVFFSTYRNSRLMGPGAFKSLVDKHRGIGEIWGAKPWAHGAFLISGFSNMPAFMTWLILFYFGQRQYQYREWTNDEIETSLIKRWGHTHGSEHPSLEGVRKNLTPEEQAMARGYIWRETMQSVFLPARDKFAPAGADYKTGAH